MGDEHSEGPAGHGGSLQTESNRGCLTHVAHTQDVVRLMLQFCKENGLKDSLRTLQQESQVPSPPFRAPPHERTAGREVM